MGASTEAGLTQKRYNLATGKKLSIKDRHASNRMVGCNPKCGPTDGDSVRVTDNLEVIRSSVGLVPINAPRSSNALGSRPLGRILLIAMSYL